MVISGAALIVSDSGVLVAVAGEAALSLTCSETMDVPGVPVPVPLIIPVEAIQRNPGRKQPARNSPVHMAGVPPLVASACEPLLGQVTEGHCGGVERYGGGSRDRE